MSITQQFKKVNTAFATSAFKPGEEIIADMSAVSVFAGMSRPSIVHIDVTGYIQTSM